MSLKKILLLLLLLMMPALLFSQTQAVSADSIYAHIKHLSETIGPRPMGSHSEQTALKWAEQKLINYGADSTFIMLIDKVDSHGTKINTTSGVAAGIFYGETDSAIVVGGHIDSDGREIPGANDNASGPATTLELARIWSQRPRHYTMIFCAFGGEERGLIGSHHFVEHYKEIDDVALMFSIDMTGANDDILILTETDTMMSPEWLLKDAFAMDKQLGINRLHYPTHFCTINNIDGGAGSDHIPFLERRIPAIDFTNGINRIPIHTQMDRLEFISKPMLGSCALLIDGLLQKYQKEGIPPQKSTPFILLKLLGILLYIPVGVLPFLSGLAVLSSIIAFIYSRKQRLKIEKQDRIRFSGLKLLFILFIIFIGYRLHDPVMQLLTGVRYPWSVHLYTYLWAGLIWLLLGLWVGLQLTKKWQFSTDTYVYAKRGIIILLVMTLLFAMITLRMAAYPALSLLLFSLAILLPFRPAKLILSWIAPLPMVRLMFIEVYPFMAHMFSYGGLQMTSGMLIILISTAIFILLMIWYLPFIYTCAWSAAAVPLLRNFLKTFRKGYVGIVILALLILSSIYLMTLPAYNEVWRPQVRIEAFYDMNKAESSLEITGNDFIDGVSVKTDSIDIEYNGKILKDNLTHSFTADWFRITGNETRTNSDPDTVDVTCQWQISTDRPWYSLTVKIKTDTAGFYSVDSDLIFSNRDNIITFIWSSEPKADINLETVVRVVPGAKLIRRVTAVYPDLPVPMEVTSDLATLRYRTTVTKLDTVVIMR